MKTAAPGWLAPLLAALIGGCAGRPSGLCMVLVRSGDLPSRTSLPSDGNLKALKDQGFDAIVAAVGESDPPSQVDWIREAALRVRIPLYLWIDVGRNPALADRHPEWIAGMGSHEDWRERFPRAPRPKAGERVGIYPWTPLWYRAVLEDRCRAIAGMLRGRTGGIAGVFLNQVQGAPSACGCGNDQCRFTVDYGLRGGPEKVSGAPAAHLISRLRKELPGVEWIPVWVTECEEVDQGEGGTGYCRSVPCFGGLCWKESTREVEGLVRVVAGPLALLCATRRFGRDLPRYQAPGGWPKVALRLHAAIAPRHGRAPLGPERFIAVLEARGASPEEERRLAERALAAGARGVVLSRLDFDEGWEPRIVPAASGEKPGGTRTDH